MTEKDVIVILNPTWGFSQRKSEKGYAALRTTPSDFISLADGGFPFPLIKSDEYI